MFNHSVLWKHRYSSDTDADLKKYTAVYCLTSSLLKGLLSWEIQSSQLHVLVAKIRSNCARVRHTKSFFSTE